MIVETIRKTIIILLIGFCTYCSFEFIYDEFIKKKEIDCGVIISHSSDEISIKHGVSTELYLNIQFEKQGFISKEVSPTLYFKYENGDKICFTINEKDTPKKMIIYSFALLTLTILFIMLLMIFIDFIMSGEEAYIIELFKKEKT